MQTRERKGTCIRKCEHKSPRFVESTLPPPQPNASIGDTADAAWVRELAGWTVALCVGVVVKPATIRHFQKSHSVTEGKKTSSGWSHLNFTGGITLSMVHMERYHCYTGWPDRILSPILNTSTDTDFLAWMARDWMPAVAESLLPFFLFLERTQFIYLWVTQSFQAQKANPYYPICSLQKALIHKVNA